ncbi:MAG: glucan biosynthesis protein [Luteimonas sp.]
MHRRDIIKTAALLPLAALPGGLTSAFAATRTPVSAFNDSSVAAMARALAAKPFRPSASALPAALANISYDQYRDYRYRAARALWRDDGLKFQAQFFHRGFLFKDRVDVFTLADGHATPFAFSTDLFDYAPQPVPPLGGSGLGETAVGDVGFAGFRLHAPLNSDAYFDEICTFLGASYFRAVAKGLSYGLSARGLALGTGDPAPEEFPAFKAFWLQRPAKDGDAIVVHALLDGPSVAGAFRFRIKPGTESVFDVDARLYPRIALGHAGIAPLTSMYQFDANDRVGIDDYRPAVHDSDGLAIFNGRGEQVWRPLHNPKTLQHSGFQDLQPRGFGLMQRKRAFADYLDAEAGYEKRPSAWVEPLGDWGEGEVHLVELPTADEYHDNIVAFWRPKTALAAGREHRYRYRLHWCREHAWLATLATVTGTRLGAAPHARDARLVVITFCGGRLDALKADAVPRIEASASSGALRNPVVQRVGDDGWRLSFELAAGDAPAVELRARLVDDGGPLTETWLYRWTP